MKFAVENYLELPEATQTWAKRFLRDAVFAEDTNIWVFRLEQIEDHYRYENYSFSPSEVQTLATMIGKYVQFCAKYKLNTPRMPADQGDFARWFLEEGESGYCTHYATAAVVLLRAAGIPARYASGYLTDVEAGVPTAVTSDRAHAWAEYFLPGTGWVILDATPPEAQRARPERAPATQPTEPKETTEPKRPETQPTEPPAVQDQQPEASKQANPILQKLGKLLWQAGKLLLLAAAVWYQSRLRLWLRNRWLQNGEPKQQILRRWRYVKYLSRLAGKKPSEELHELALEAKFSNHSLTDAHVSPMAEGIASLCRELRQKNLLWQCAYRVLLALW